MAWHFLCEKFAKKSGRQDLNLRPLAPKASALPNCATSRFTICNFFIHRHSERSKESAFRSPRSLALIGIWLRKLAKCVRPDILFKFLIHFYFKGDKKSIIIYFAGKIVNRKMGKIGKSSNFQILKSANAVHLQNRLNCFC